MLSHHEVACSFIPAFFELLASNPAELAEMYCHQSSFTVVDYEYGTSEARGAGVYKAVEQWAQIVQGHQLSVESYTAEPIYGGVIVFVSMTATSETVRHFFQLVTVLEACSVAESVTESYFIRHQMIIRPGFIAIEPPAEEAAQEAEEEQELAVEETPVEEPAPVAQPEQQQQQQAAPTPKKSRESPASAAVPSVAPEPAEKRPAKPTTWASLASAPPSKTEPRQPVKVITATNGSKADLTEAAAAPRKQDTRDAAGTAAKPYTRPPRSAPPAPVGDRLMFNISEGVSDDEVRTALGSWAAHIVSLRNNSKKNGCVFVDFAPDAKVMDVIKDNQLLVGAKKMRVTLHRQRSRGE